MIAAAVYLGVNPVLYTGIIPCAAVISLLATYRIVENDKRMLVSQNVGLNQPILKFVCSLHLFVAFLLLWHRHWDYGGF